METKLTERLNKEMLRRIARAREIGKIDSRWNDNFMRQWYVYLWHIVQPVNDSRICDLSIAV